MGVLGAIRARHVIATIAVLTLASGCGRIGGFFGGGSNAESGAGSEAAAAAAEPRGSTFTDLFANVDDPNTTIEVNKYLWNASLDILNFLPIQSADPFSGIIVTGFGTPPGGSQAYRATIYVRDPALDARSLNVALATRSGPASTETVRAIEDAILTRARQLRIRDLNL
ncbi:MAG: DUF3576 domain-containing protein [Paracoccaceae bacterium]|nr:DUF3576 domain-containing protein [Paracoccaceae bacterium]